jgi:rhodanese-related sulfurtransferase
VGKNMKLKQGNETQKRTFPIWSVGAIVLLLVVVISYGVIQAINSAASQYPSEISVTKAAELRDQSAFILDVRQPEEWAQFHIPGATLIPLGELPNRLNEVPKDKEIVVVCRTGHRSAQGRDILKNAGFTKVTSMTGGVTQWQSAGLPIATGQ